MALQAFEMAIQWKPNTVEFRLSGARYTGYPDSTVYLYTLAVSPSLGGSRQHKRNKQLEFGERLISPPLPFFHAVSEENSTEEGIPSPLAPSLLVAFYDT